MANYKLILGHVLKFEGGCSSDPRDNALKLGHSGVLGKDAGTTTYLNNYVHTCKGVIWATYVGYCNRVGKKPNPQEFVKMPLPLFEDIVKKLYWDSLYLDTLKSQAIAEFLFDMVWGSGLGGIKGQVRDLQNFLISKKVDLVGGADGSFGKNTIIALNNYVKTKAREKEVIDVLYNSRSKFLKGLEDTGSYGRGWLRRLDELTARAYSLIGETAKKPIVKIGAILLIGVSGFFLYKGLKKA